MNRLQNKNSEISPSIILFLFVVFTWIVEFNCNISSPTDVCVNFTAKNQPDPPQENPIRFPFYTHSEAAASTASSSPSFEPFEFDDIV